MFTYNFKSIYLFPKMSFNNSFSKQNMSTSNSKYTYFNSQFSQYTDVEPQRLNLQRCSTKQSTAYL